MPVFQAVRRKLLHLRNLHYIKSRINLKEQVVLLNSFPRSGNTWVRSVLSNYLQQRAGFDLRSTRAPVDWELVVPDVDAHRISKVIRLDLSLIPIIKTHHTYDELIRYLGRTACTATGHICLYRNPIDCLVSYYHLMITRKNVSGVEIDDFCRTHYPRWEAHLSSFLDADVPVHFMSYEQMNASPFETLASLLHYMQIAVEDNSLRNAIKQKEFGRLSQNQSVETNKRFYRVGKVGTGREELSADTVAELEDKSHQCLILANERSKTKAQQLELLEPV